MKYLKILCVLPVLVVTGCLQTLTGKGVEYAKENTERERLWYLMQSSAVMARQNPNPAVELENIQMTPVDPAKDSSIRIYYPTEHYNPTQWDGKRGAGPTLAESLAPFAWPAAIGYGISKGVTLGGSGGGGSASSSASTPSATPQYLLPAQ